MIPRKAGLVFQRCLTRVQRTRPRASCIDRLVVTPGRAAELRCIRGNGGDMGTVEFG